MEMLSQTPRVLVDGAHNAASLDAMMRAIGQHIPYDSMVVIFGCCADKDVAGHARADHQRRRQGDLHQGGQHPHRRSRTSWRARYVELYGKMAQVAPTLEDALAIANRAVTKEDLICITGSFYLVGEAKKYFAAKAAQQ